MPKFTDGITIPRRLVRVGVVTKDAVFSKGGMFANVMLSGKEIDELPIYANSMFNYKKLRGILFGVNQDKMAMDLINDTAGIEYPAMNVTPELHEIQKQLDGFAVADNYSLESLLEYLGFPEEMTTYELRKLRDILTSRKEIRKLALPCAYGKIDTRKTNVLDYQQAVKLGLGEYYKSIGERTEENDRVHFCKSVSTEIKQQIYPKIVFELLVQNQSLGYNVTDRTEYDIVKKRLARK